MLLLSALLAVCALVYSGVWDHGFVNFDDDLFIYHNSLIRSLEWPALGRLFELQILTPYYKPLVYLSWALEYRFFGLDPRAYHVDNLLLHLVNTALVFWILRRICAAVPRLESAAPWGPLLVTALFALHPMRVESVAWATERKDVLFGFFFLSSLASYLAYAVRGRPIFLAGSALLFLLGTLCKAMIVTLPLTFFVVDILLERPVGKRLAFEKIPHLVVLVGALGLYGFLFRPAASEPAAGSASPALLQSAETLILGAADSAVPEPPEAGLHSAAAGSAKTNVRLAAAGYRVSSFATRLFWPRDLAVIYPVPSFLTSEPRGRWLLPSLGLLSLAVAFGVWALWRRSVLGAGAVFFFVTLSPALFVSVFGTNFAPDRYTYIPAIGWAVVVVALVAGLARRLPAWKGLIHLAAALYTAALSVAAYQQVGVWKSSLTLWQSVIDRYGETAVALNNRGAAHKEAGDTQQAIADFEGALELDPLKFNVYNNRALVRHELGDTSGAFEDLDRAIELRPDEAKLYANRGAVAVDAGQLVVGIGDYSRAIALEPRLADAYLLRAVARQQLGDFAGAIPDLEEALVRGSDPVETIFQRGAARMRIGDYEGALADNARVLKRQPRDARALNNRGFARFYLGDLEGALEDLDQAIRLEPTYAIAFRNRGDVKSARGDLESGCEDWGTALTLEAPEATARLIEFCG